MSKKSLNLDEYDKLIDTFAGQLWLLRELWMGIQGLREQLTLHPDVLSEYATFWGWVYRGWVHDLYAGIFRLVDESNGVESLVKLLKKESEHKPDIANKEVQENLVKEEREIIKTIKSNPTVIRIKKYRHEIMAHLSSQMALDETYSAEFYSKNITPNEIESLLNSLGEFLKKAARRGTFQPSTLPRTPIKSEVRKIFDKLAQDSNLAVNCAREENAPTGYAGTSNPCRDLPHE